ncbi:glycosyltransferase family 4 protein [Thermoflexus sp.]|uniref:glycosyltransferase family 4 protein n=1 Tax=Thermoflexus sp. TaxID=1969742 RepID=UPI002ADDDB7B|nr:glycosyltransferase family 4 protein [Thermoflexus sp.]
MGPGRERWSIVMIGPFGLRARGTMRARALPMAQALARRGHPVTVILPPWPTQEEAGRSWEEEGVRILILPAPHGPPFHLQVAIRMAREIVGQRPDIVHAFKPKAYPGFVHWILRHLRRAGGFRGAVVVDTDDWEGPGGWNDRHPYSPWQRRLFAWQERWGMTHADALTVASRTLETLAWAMGIPPQRVFYLPNAAWFVGPSRPLPAGPPTVVLYTRFLEFQLDRLIRVMEALAQRSSALRFLYVGQPLGNEEARFREAAARAGLLDRIDWEGWVEPARLPQVLGRGHLALYLMDDDLINRAKCPMKLIDLLATGLPVVADAVGQVPEYIRHGETGWLVPPGEVGAMVEAAWKLLQDPEAAWRIGENARRMIDVAHRWAHRLPALEAAYAEALARAGR